MRAARRHLLPALAVLASACEPVDPMDHPFQPVPVKAEAVPSTAASATASATGATAPVDPRFADFDQGFSISSEDLNGGAALGDDGDADAVDADTPAEEPATPPSEEPPAPAATTTLPVASMAASAPMVAQVPAAPLGWAIRLVSTLPEAQPPRAILGLPDGREIVVTPGSMVPDAGLVVLSIGTQGVQLARVQAMGDHATVDPISLTPQY